VRAGGEEMKSIPLLLLLVSCTVDRLVDRIEVPPNQLWDVYIDLRVMKVDSFKRYQLITAIPYGKPYPKYSYQWHDYHRTVSIGDIIPLEDSLRSIIKYKHNWKSSNAK
jgi:hypothetical protein